MNEPCQTDIPDIENHPRVQELRRALVGCTKLLGRLMQDGEGLLAERILAVLDKTASCGLLTALPADARAKAIATMPQEIRETLGVAEPLVDIPVNEKDKTLA